MDLSLIYFPSAIALGALHALEPGHAKTLTAAYLIGTKGTKFDATLLGLSVAFTHSLVVIGLSIIAVLLGREAFTDDASYVLAIVSSIIVIVLGFWLLNKRLANLRRAKLRSSELHHSHAPERVHIESHSLIQSSDFHHHDHALMSDEEHARAHASTLPDYVHKGERPTFWQIMAFGAAGGLIPCPAAISVMLLSLSLSQSGKGLIMVLGFSIGLAITLVGVGLLIVTGLSKLASTGKLSRLSVLAPSIAACMVVLSGTIGLITAVVKHG